LEGADPDLIRVVVDLLDTPSLAAIWTLDAMTEVDITAEVHGLGRVHGTIDRLIVGPEKVSAIDFKSNRIVPETPEQTPEGLLQQMSLYHAALSAIYSDRPVEVAILWTETATLMPLPQDLLHEALKSVSLP
jgi:ATP-dependent helicase/nuclease subunit A